MSGKGLLAIGLAVIAGVFLALVIQARSDEPSRPSAEREDGDDELARFGECQSAVRAAVSAAGDQLAMYIVGARAKVEEIAGRRCRDDRWPPEVTSCLQGAKDANAMSRCIGKLDPDDHSRLMAELEEIPRGPLPEPDLPPIDDVDNLDDDDIAEPDGPSLDPNATGPAACMEYGRIIERYAACDKIPEATRTALKDAYAQMSSAWAGMPSSAWPSMDSACRQATDAMKQAMTQLCP